MLKLVYGASRNAAPRLTRTLGAVQHRPPTPPRRARRRVLIAFVALLAPLISLVWGWLATREERAILELSEAERHEAYLRELASFDGLCSDPPPALRSRCNAKARFLLAFPDCDADCQQLAAKMASRPMR